MFKIWGSCLLAAGALLVASPSFAQDACVNSPDINGDGIVDESDVQIMRDALGSAEGDGRYVAAADLNDDGLVTTVDYAAMLACS